MLETDKVSSQQRTDGKHQDVLFILLWLRLVAEQKCNLAEPSRIVLQWATIHLRLNAYNAKLQGNKKKKQVLYHVPRGDEHYTCRARQGIAE